ncbi:MAG TPA: type VI secretion system-associated FHA domain protein [Planctomycetota bacterium]|nr:type VI secretion system-associated FHA domain protein [Planctomycetota bacterium]
MSSFKLIVTMRGNEAAVLSEHAFSKDQVSIGRALGNDIVLPDVEKRVSSKHARIDRGRESYELVDLGSTNGTFLNDKKVRANTNTPLKNGDQILVGLYYLRFVGVGEKPEKTMVMVDPSRKTSEIADELPLLWARHAGDPPEARRNAIKQFIQGEVAAVGSKNARAILSQLQMRFRAQEGLGAGAKGTDLRQRDAEIQKREDQYKAGLKAVGELSTKFVGPEGFETAEQVERFGKLILQTIEVTLDWISKSLKGRKEFEDQFSADLTMVFGRGANPIKQGGGPEEIGRFLLDWRKPRSPLAIREALDGAFKDLTMHQLGLLAGVQESLAAVLKRLDPKVVEAEAKEMGVGGMFASLDKRAWKRYSDIFAEIFSENSKLFNEMIYPNVRKGYLGTHSDSPTGTEGATVPRAEPLPPEGTKK